MKKFTSIIRWQPTFLWVDCAVIFTLLALFWDWSEEGWPQFPGFWLFNWLFWDKSWVRNDLFLRKFQHFLCGKSKMFWVRRVYYGTFWTVRTSWTGRYVLWYTLYARTFHHQQTYPPPHFCCFVLGLAIVKSPSKPQHCYCHILAAKVFIAPFLLFSQPKSHLPLRISQSNFNTSQSILTPNLTHSQLFISLNSPRQSRFFSLLFSPFFFYSLSSPLYHYHHQQTRLDSFQPQTLLFPH